MAKIAKHSKTAVYLTKQIDNCGLAVKTLAILWLVRNYLNAHPAVNYLGLHIGKIMQYTVHAFIWTNIMLYALIQCLYVFN